MLLGFKRQFAPYVEEGSKTHTLRAKRKHRPWVGETCHCYVDPRQQTMRLLGRFECVLVQNVEIRAHFNPHVPLLIAIDGAPLTDDEAEVFLFRDGFRAPFDGPDPRVNPSMRSAARFWRDQLKEGPWDGDLIHWRFAPAARAKGAR